ncbi:MAG: hypothetical protein IPJ65_32165 [Archangiaceae bacterium]|nr:hypothetical protein [Archangiaceae bacterium]
MIKRLIILVATVAASTAVADAPAKPNGIKIGEGRLHPFLSVRAGYDSAAGYFPTTGSTALSLSGDVVITPTAGLLFNWDTPSTMVNFNGSGGFVWYTGLVTPNARDLSYPTATVGLDTAFNKTGAVEVDVGDNFTYSNHTGNVAAGIGILALYNSAYLRVPIHPGGGALSVTPAVRWDNEFFSPQFRSALPGCSTMGTIDITCDPAQVNKMDYSNVNVGLGAKWKFLPKTAAVLDAQFDYRWYWRTTPPATPPPGTPPNTGTNLNSQLLRITGGLSGLITSHISTLLVVGGGGDWGGSHAATFIAQAEVAYLGQEITARGGYIRTLNPVPVFGIYGQDRGYAEIKSTLFGRVGLRGFGSFDYLSFYNSSARNDYIITAAAEVSVQIISILSVAATYNLSYRETNSGMQGAKYIRHEPFLTLTLSY